MDLVKTLRTLLCVYVGAAFVSADQDKKEKFRSYLLNIEESQKLYLEATALNAQLQNTINGLQSNESAQQDRIATLESNESAQQDRIATLELQLKVRHYW